MINNVLDDVKNFKAISQKISRKNILKLAINNLFEKKIRFIIAMMTIILSFSILSLALVISGFDRPYVDSKNIINNNVNKYLITSNKDNIWIYNSTAEKITDYQDLQYIRNGVIESINDVIKIGYILYPNYQEITDESIVISDFEVYMSSQLGTLFYISNDYEVSKQKFSFDRFNEYYIKDYNNCKIAGIYHTFRFSNLSNTDINSIGTEIHDKAQLNHSEEIIFHTSNSNYVKGNNYFINGNKFGEFTLSVNQDILNNNLSSIDSIFTYNSINNYFDDDKHIVTNDNEYVLNGNEIFLSLNIYNCIFNEQSDYNYYLGDKFFEESSLIRKPLHINECVDLIIIENSETKEKLELRNLIIKGIIVDLGNDSIALSAELKKQIDDFTMNNKILVKTASIKDQNSFLKGIYNNYGFYADYFYTEHINSFQEDLQIARFVCNILIPLLIILIILINTIVISQIVKSKDKENGILRAIGIKKHSIINVYLLQSIFIIVISFIISLVIAIIFISIINNLLVSEYSNSIGLLLFRYQYALVMIIITIIVNLFICYASLYKAISKNPVDVIRQN